MFRMFLRLVTICGSLYLSSIPEDRVLGFFIFLATFITLDLATSNFFKKSQL